MHLEFVYGIHLGTWRWSCFLVLWILVFGLLGMYLLGKLQLVHEEKSAGIGVPRLFLSIIILA